MKKVSMELGKEYINKGAKCVALDKEGYEALFYFITEHNNE